MTVGVLAFQGDFAEHLEILDRLKVDAIEVRNLSDLAKVSRLIIPGGESTVIAKFLEETGVGDVIKRRASKSLDSLDSLVSSDSLIIYGTCAGAIVLAKEITGEKRFKPLGLIDITVERNAYGRQIDSFRTELSIKGIKSIVPASFIRAPIITRVGKGVEVLAEHEGRPVLVRQGNILAGTFHPEVRGETGIHEMFVGMR